jgi:DNA-binding NarL/FixJ family response regulator
MPLRCVIVDDNARVLRAASDLLGGQGITVVGLARTGDEALAVAEEVHPDVVLVDIDLGSDSGFDVARRLADGGNTTGSRTILISTREEADFEDLIAVSPAVGFLSKSELSAPAIYSLMERRGREGT